MKKAFQFFTTLVSKCTRAIKRIKSSEMAEFGLKSQHVSCLYYLYVAESPLTAKELCDVCGEDKASVSRSLVFLEKNGYVDCKTKAMKRYKSPIYLTEKGKIIAEDVTSKVDEIVKKASEGLTEDNRETFRQCLTLIEKNLEKISLEEQEKV